MDVYVSDMLFPEHKEIYFEQQDRFIFGSIISDFFWLANGTRNESDISKHQNYSPTLVDDIVH